MKAYFVSLVVLFISFGVHANTLVKVLGKCDAVLRKGAHQLVKPEFSDWLTEHESFKFSSDGKNVLIRHKTYPEIEEITVLSLETGVKQASFSWNGRDAGFFGMHSFDFDQDSGQIVGLGRTAFAGGTDAILHLDGKGFIEKIDMSEPHKRDFVRASGKLQEAVGSEVTRSSISLRQPYYVRTLLQRKKNSNGLELSAQLIDWQHRTALNLGMASPRMVSVSWEPISEEFRYISILQSDERVMEIHPLDNVAASLSLAPESRTKLVHDEPVLSATLMKEAPLIVTQTELGLHIWNAKTGQKQSEILGPVTDFRVLEKMGVLAYTDNVGRLIFYSLVENRSFARFSNFTRFNLDSHINNYQSDVAFVTLDNGETLRVIKDIETQQFLVQYMRISASDEGGIVTEIETEKSKYFVKAHSVRSEDYKSMTLVVEVYLSDSSDKVLTLEYPMNNELYPGAAIDPTGQTIVYPADKITTGILHLKKLLTEKGL